MRKCWSDARRERPETATVSVRDPEVVAFEASGQRNPARDPVRRAGCAHYGGRTRTEDTSRPGRAAQALRQFVGNHFFPACSTYAQWVVRKGPARIALKTESGSEGRVIFLVVLGHSGFNNPSLARPKPAVPSARVDQ